MTEERLTATEIYLRNVAVERSLSTMGVLLEQSVTHQDGIERRASRYRLPSNRQLLIIEECMGDRLLRVYQEFIEAENPDFQIYINDRPYHHDYAAAHTVSFTPKACQGCRNYHGQTHGGNRLICAIHLSGVEDDECGDWEENAVENGKTILDSNREQIRSLINEPVDQGLSVRIQTFQDGTTIAYHIYNE